MEDLDHRQCLASDARGRNQTEKFEVYEGGDFEDGSAVNLGCWVSLQIAVDNQSDGFQHAPRDAFTERLSPRLSNSLPQGT